MHTTGKTLDANPTFFPTIPIKSAIVGNQALSYPSITKDALTKLLAEKVMAGKNKSIIPNTTRLFPVRKIEKSLFLMEMTRELHRKNAVEERNVLTSTTILKDERVR
jgi:hypothetical protein